MLLHLSLGIMGGWSPHPFQSLEWGLVHGSACTKAMPCTLGYSRMVGTHVHMDHSRMDAQTLDSMLFIEVLIAGILMLDVRFIRKTQINHETLTSFRNGSCGHPGSKISIFLGVDFRPRGSSGIDCHVVDHPKTIPKINQDLPIWEWQKIGGSFESIWVPCGPIWVTQIRKTQINHETLTFTNNGAPARSAGAPLLAKKGVS